MVKLLAVALRMTAVTLVLTGIVYPFVVTGVAQALFPSRAGGSLARDSRGRVVGSELIGQGFAGSAYVHPRPSAAGSGYDATASSGSNFGPTSKRLQDRVRSDLAKLMAENPGAGPVPADLVTASGSGLDPDLSPKAALWQVPRVAAARRVEAARVRSVVESQVIGRDLGFLGEPRVNVLQLNLALDRQFGAPPSPEVAAAPSSSGTAASSPRAQGGATP